MVWSPLWSTSPPQTKEVYKGEIKADNKQIKPTYTHHSCQSEVSMVWYPLWSTSPPHTKEVYKVEIKADDNNSICNLFNISEHSRVSWYSYSCFHPIRIKISFFLDQSENRDCSIVLLNSLLICYVMFLLYILPWHNSHLARYIWRRLKVQPVPVDLWFISGISTKPDATKWSTSESISQ